jgi:acetyltransferase-like isoleucine patch superfamily enzyme
MRRLWLHAVYRMDRALFAVFLLRWRSALRVNGDVSPNLRLAHVRVEPGGRIEVGPGFATERQAGNRLWVQAGGALRIGPDSWLRTEHGVNRLTVFPGARIELGPRCLMNAAMLTAKSEISIGSDALIGFGVRVFDADLHDLDASTPERVDPVRIGDRVWIGADSMVLRGVTIGDDVVVGAHSVVTSDLPAGVLAVGAPAKPIRTIGSREGCH